MLAESIHAKMVRKLVSHPVGGPVVLPELGYHQQLQNGITQTPPPSAL